MKIEFIDEPELEFGTGRSVDIRFGLTNYHPVDFDNRTAPKSIRVGIVGNNETVEGMAGWLEKCRNEIQAKQSNQPNLFPKFPGFRLDTGFNSELILDSSLQRIISQRQLDEAFKAGDINNKVINAVNLYLDELAYLNENANVDVLICAIPEEVFNIGKSISDESDEDESTSYNRSISSIDFHDLLKAKAMRLGVPIQLVLPSTYDSKKKRTSRSNPALTRMLQDEATRAWNFHTAIYYKAKGIPWRLLRNPSDYSTCYVGVTFFKTDNDMLRTSVAQVFNERGEGVIVRGGLARFDKEDRQVHLEQKDATTLLTNSLNLYKKEHGAFPARLVLHKSSTYNKSEVDGFLESASSFSVDNINLLSVEKSFTRLFRMGKYPPLRGTFLSLDKKQHILYTRGSVPFFATYPGMYVPKTFGFKTEIVEETPYFLAKEILALTKMNWNNTQFDGGEPITTRASRQVGKILKYIEDGDPIAPSYRYYM